MENRNKVVSIEAYKIKKGGLSSVMADMARIEANRKNKQTYPLADSSLPAPVHFLYHKRKRANNS